MQFQGKTEPKHWCKKLLVDWFDAFSFKFTTTHEEGRKIEYDIEGGLPESTCKWTNKELIIFASTWLNLKCFVVHDPSYKYYHLVSNISAASVSAATESALLLIESGSENTCWMTCWPLISARFICDHPHPPSVPRSSNPKPVLLFPHCCRDAY